MPEFTEEYTDLNQENYGWNTKSVKTAKNSLEAVEKAKEHISRTFGNVKFEDISPTTFRWKRNDRYWENRVTLKK